MAARADGKLGFVIIDSDAGARGVVRKHLVAGGHRVTAEADDLNAGLRLVRGVRPDVLVLDLGEAANTLESVSRLREEFPGMGIVIVSSDSSPQLILSCMRAGAHEFLTRPLDMVEVDRAVERLQRTLAPMAGSGAPRGRVFCVYPAKGGAGGSSLATNLALSLVSEDREVALVDFNLQVGDLGLMLDMTPKHTFAAAAGEEAVDESKLRSLMSPHASGLSLLTISDRPEEADVVQRDHVPEIFGHLTTMFDYVVVDLGRHIDDRSIQLFDLCDSILMVSSQDVPGIRNARRYADLLDRLEVPRERIHLVVNRHHPKSRVSNRDVEDTVGMDVFWSLPNDFRSMSAAIDSGNPIVLDSPKSKLARSFFELGEILVQKYSTGSRGQLVAAAPDGN
ncbi:MAG TPA: response regulator [bacterium]|nr:response regulator [bacterium]